MPKKNIPSDKRFLAKDTLIKILLFIGATAVILAIVPRADHQSFTYELNQPWKYPLLTAEFDTPIMRDSASAKAMRDSIESNFSPFIRRNSETPAANLQRFRTIVAPHASQKDVNLLTTLLAEAYGKGIVSAELYNSIQGGNNKKVRHYNGDEDPTDRTVSTSDGSGYIPPKMAFSYIDSCYSAVNGLEKHSLPAQVAKALTMCITPDIMLDTAVDNQFRNQEYLNVNGALGVIKKGQRIVDRGEIVTAQIYTNLNTYQELLATTHSETRNQNWYIAGQSLYIVICLSILYLFLSIYRSAFFADIRKMSFLMIFITLFVVLATLMFEYVPLGIYLVPFAAVPVVIMIFFDSRTAIFSLVTTVMLGALVAAFPFQFIFLEFIAGISATFSIHQLSKRSQLLRTALITFVSYSICYTALCLLTEGNLDSISIRMFVMFLINSVVLSFAYILILVVEKLFGFTSMVTLVELSDINNPLLHRLAEEAPGTFQHSMQVSTLAAEAARAIGANTQLVRTGALYHDIGKTESPIFFTENQHGVNPHAGLDPETSAQKIIRHVTDGVALASKAKLPAVIKDFILQHHGKGVTKYFYNTAVNESDGAVPVDKTKFMYPGPNPQSRETAILMMADAIEAASRSLKDFTQDSIYGLVDRIIDGQIQDGMFEESPLSFKDINIIKSTFKKRLGNIYHSRVAYPEIKKPV